MFVRNVGGYRAALAAGGLGLAVVLPTAAALAGPGHTIAYPGQFHQSGYMELGGQPGAGTMELQVTKVDAPVGGGQKGETQELSNVKFVGGVAEVELAFGPDLFDGRPRFLEVGVRPA